MYLPLDMDCPANTVYNSDMSLDVATCDNPEAEYTVSMGRGEGCECLAGFIVNGNECLNTNDCGCTVPLDDPIYLTVC